MITYMKQVSKYLLILVTIGFIVTIISYRNVGYSQTADYRWLGLAVASLSVVLNIYLNNKR